MSRFGRRQPQSQPRRAVNGATPMQRGPAAAPVLRGPQRERHEADWVLLLAVVALAALGILMVYSSTGVEGLLDQNPFGTVGPQALWGVIGAIAMIVVMRIDYRYLRLLSVPLFIVALGLLLIVEVGSVGPIRVATFGGSSRWLQIGPLPAMQPPELAKLALVIYLAHWLARRGGRVTSFRDGLLPFVVILGIVVVLIVREPDLGTASVIGITGLVMFFVAGGRLRHFALMIPAGLAAMALLVSTNAYQIERVQVLLNPWADPQGAGHQTIQGLLALGMGGATGIGLGQSVQPGTAIALPQSQNDFVFALLGQELGFIGAVAVIGLYLLVAYRGIRIALGAPDTFGALLATGITAWLVLQAFINIAVVVVLLPITGITLPFISAGGSSLLVSFGAVGILLSISRETLPRGTFNNADPDRGRGHRRPRLPGVGRRALPTRASA
jgi:cell division protein FtsW